MSVKSITAGPAAALFLSILATPASAQEPLPPGQSGGSTVSAPAPAADTAAIQKQVDELKGDVKKLKGLKIGGFVQARFELDQTSKDGVNKDGRTLLNKDQFSVRRGRIKTTYTGIPYSEVVLQIDAVGSGLSLIDAEVSGLSPWKGFDGKITAGQTKIPFGFEIAQSSADRELPERSLMINRFFPGVRDRGVKLSANVNVLRLSAGVFNGNGISDTATTYDYQTDKDANGTIDEGEEAVTTSSAINFGNTDRDTKKDVAGRVGVDLKFLVAGINGYYGQWGKIPTLIATKDPETGVTTYAGGDTLEYIKKTRIGADVQLNLDLIKALGKTTLRGEYVQGHGLFYSTRQDDVDARGWYATLVQGLGSKFSLAARVDQFDPNLEKEDDTTLTIEPALLFHPTQALRVTASYQVINDHDDTDDSGAKVDRANNHFTLQFQGRF